MRRPIALAGITGAIALIAAMLFWWVSRSATPQAPARVAAQVVGRVELSPGAALPALTAGATVVVYAYALDGPRVPLAVLRRPASSLPFDFKLDDSLAPNPAFRLSQAPQLVVGARLGSGDAASPLPGDWIAPSQTVATDAHGVRLVLQAPRP